MNMITFEDISKELVVISTKFECFQKRLNFNEDFDPRESFPEPSYKR